MKPDAYPELGTCIVFGVNEAPFLGEGWYGRERFHGGIVGRQTARRGTLRVDLLGAGELALTCVGHTQTLGHPLRGSVWAGDVKLGDVVIERNAWKTLRFPLPAGLDGESLIIETENPWCPDNYFHNGDGRMVGLVVSAVRIGYESPEAGEPA